MNNGFECLFNVLSQFRDQHIEYISLSTFHKLYITSCNDILFQTPNRVALNNLIIMLKGNKLALYFKSLSKFVGPIDKNGNFINMDNPFWFDYDRVSLDQICIKYGDLYFSARPSRERHIISLRNIIGDFEKFTIYSSSFTYIDINNLSDCQKDLMTLSTMYDDLYNSFMEFKKIVSDQKNELNKKYNHLQKLNNNPNWENGLKDWYFNQTGEVLNLDSPKTFNEKIQWIKLYRTDSWMTRLADKVKVRDFVLSSGYGDLLIPVYSIVEHPDSIDYSTLPEKFVIKCNHGCGMNLFIKDKSKVNFKYIRTSLLKYMNINYAYSSFELQYLNIKPRIIIEPYIENYEGELYDFKIWCFHGSAKYIMVLSGRRQGRLKMAFYDRDWNKQDFTYGHPLDPKIIDRPDNLTDMLNIAEHLSKGFEHVRVDLYRLNDGKLFFGEMTFTSASGLCGWSDPSINQEFGNLINLPTDNNKLTF